MTLCGSAHIYRNLVIQQIPRVIVPAFLLRRWLGGCGGLCGSAWRRLGLADGGLEKNDSLELSRQIDLDETLNHRFLSHLKCVDRAR